LFHIKTDEKIFPDIYRGQSPYHPASSKNLAEKSANQNQKKGVLPGDLFSSSEPPTMFIDIIPG